MTHSAPKGHSQPVRGCCSNDIIVTHVAPSIVIHAILLFVLPSGSFLLSSLLASVLFAALFGIVLGTECPTETPCVTFAKPHACVKCNTFGETTDCFDKCCKRSAHCLTPSCVAAFGASAQKKCTGNCFSSVKCVKDKAACSSVTHNCYGKTKCKTPACGGFTDGELCIYINRNDFNVCEFPSGGVGDPQFTGLRGQSYQVHGVSGYVYNIVSDPDVQFNSRFIFLDRGECPILDGVRQSNCFSHPGSYLGELGLKTAAGDRIHVVTGDAQTGFAAITVNNSPLSVGDIALLADDMGVVAYNTTHLTTINIGNWLFEFENSDQFVNERVDVIDSRNMRSHGMLGQTWREVVYPNAIKFIEGTVDDYVIRGGDIFGDDFMYNAFN